MQSNLPFLSKFGLLVSLVAILNLCIKFKKMCLSWKWSEIEQFGSNFWSEGHTQSDLPVFAKNCYPYCYLWRPSPICLENGTR